MDEARPLPEPEPAPLARPAGPVRPAERIVSLDVLRGFAILGILVMNVQSFSAIKAAYANPSAYGDLTGIHFVAWFVGHVFFELKFMAIFSMLFGAGVLLAADRAGASSRSPAGLHYRRMGWLLLFGLAHAYLLWFGDILFFYGVCGMLVYPLRKLAPGKLIILGVALLAIASILSFSVGALMPFLPADEQLAMSADWAPAPEAIEQELAAYRSGWLGQFADRAPTALMFETGLLLFWGLWRCGGLMLVGMALYRRGFFNATLPARSYIRALALGAAVGLPLILAGVAWNVHHQWSARYSLFFGSQFNYWGSVPLALALVAAVMLACREGFLPRLQRRLAAIGRTALSNYLLQTVLGTTIFYGHGLGLYGSMERAELVAVVLAIWAVQLVVSPWWVSRFRFGPVEWLWRSLTYLRFQPFRR